MNTIEMDFVLDVFRRSLRRVSISHLLATTSVEGVYEIYSFHEKGH